MKQDPKQPSPFSDLSAAQHGAPAVFSEPLAANFSASSVDDRFSHSKYEVRKQFFKMLGGAFRIYDENERLLFYSKQKAFKLKEDIRLYTGEDMTREVLRIGARNILDMSATYDVFDSQTNEKIGAFKRRGFKSMLQDEWAILDNLNREVGMIKEDSTALAVIRRFIEYASLFIPQSFHVTVGNRDVAIFQQNRNPFLAKIALDFSLDVSGLLDRRLGLAAAVLVCAIEGKQH